ncbi:grasp-with-spasm system ATP-grasp peptide maturase [Zhouia amylolytica]|uniref:MvdD-like pre-ATP grasp domain-containing protein n=1 Tax=Zhouia amylolytica AD3 TaxID=1286632 RepID=W2URM2_9FLAO|nr:grasp-with-spasm system ATP-grasp peptide maturase [Zhouia amylolytica]ETN96131.1 hypothetical protein P278_09580 [Zhouia amylolytica AD3]
MDKINVLVVSEEGDNTTDTVLKWIKYYGGNFLRLNNTSKLYLDHVHLGNEGEDVTFYYEEKAYRLSDFTAYWYRRGRLNFTYPKTPEFQNQKLQKEVSNSLDREYTYINNYIYNYFEKKKDIPTIGSIYDNQTNKVTNLLKARNVGLKIPETIITSSKEHLLEFKNKTQKVLIKPIYQAGFLYEDENTKTSGLSVLLGENEINGLPDKFMPTLVQGYVEKLYELRIFYLNGQCFSSVIFSQWDEQTKVDFRNYNWEKPNRTPPYLLPKNISAKIKTLMDELDMNSGSIDIIVTPDNEYVFLEVNPVGLFWQVSYPCNYYLEKRIAEYLCNK